VASNEPLGLQMSFVRKRSGSNRCLLRESEAAAADVFCAKAKRQRQMFFCVKAKRQQQQQDVGHEGVTTGRDGFSLRSSIASPQGIARSSLQSIYFSKMIVPNFSDKLKHYSLYLMIFSQKMLNSTLSFPTKSAE